MRPYTSTDRLRCMVTQALQKISIFVNECDACLRYANICPLPTPWRTASTSYPLTTLTSRIVITITEPAFLHIKRHPPADVLPNVPINIPKRTPAACYIRATRTDRRVPHSLRRGGRLLGAPFKMESLRDAVASNPSRGSVIGCRAALRNRLLEINSWVTKRARPRYCTAAYHWINGTSTINRLLRIAMEPVSSF